MKPYVNVYLDQGGGDESQRGKEHPDSHLLQRPAAGHSEHQCHMTSGASSHRATASLAGFLPRTTGRAFRGNSREVQAALLDERVDHVVHDGHHDQDQNGVDGLEEERYVSSGPRRVRERRRKSDVRALTCICSG